MAEAEMELEQEAQVVEQESDATKQDQELNEAESEIEEENDEDGEVIIPQFDNEEDEVKYLKQLVKQKRKANDQAKQWRLANEELENKLKKMSEEQTQKEQDALKKLQDELAEKQRLLDEAQQEIEKRTKEKAELRFSFAAEKHKVEDSEFVQHKLNSHLKSLDEEALSEFNIDNYLQELKEKHPVAFAKKPEKATTGAAPQSATQTTTTKSGNKASPNKLKTSNEWAAYRQNIGV